MMMSLGVGVQCDVIVKQEVALSHTHPSTAPSCGGSATSPIIIDSRSPSPTCLTPSPICLSPSPPNDIVVSPPVSKKAKATPARVCRKNELVSFVCSEGEFAKARDIWLKSDVIIIDECIPDNSKFPHWMHTPSPLSDLSLSDPDLPTVLPNLSLASTLNQAQSENRAQPESTFVKTSIVPITPLANSLFDLKVTIPTSTHTPITPINGTASKASVSSQEDRDCHVPHDDLVSLLNAIDETSDDCPNTIDIMEDGCVLDQCSAETRRQILEGYETEPPYKEDLQSLALRRGLLLKDTPPKVGTRSIVS